MWKKEKVIPMDNEKEKIIQTYRNYVQAFQSLNPKAILPFYQPPFMSISSREVLVLSTLAEIEDSFARNMEILRGNKYARTDIIEIFAKKMSKGLALVSVILERYSSEGEQIGGAGKTYTYTYTLRRTDNDWKIVSAMAHDSAAILRID
jgi:ketosteroid isomerase-like protein